MSLLFTQVAEAMTMRPVARSTAITDQVACATAGSMAKKAAIAVIRHIRIGIIPFLGNQRFVGEVSVRTLVPESFHGNVQIQDEVTQAMLIAQLRQLAICG